MPPITPTRALFVLTTFLLVCFLWTWGLPREYTPPALPVAHDDAHKKKPLGSQLLPEPLVDDAGGSATPELSTPGNESTSPSADVRPGLPCHAVRGAHHLMIIVRTNTASTPTSLPAPLKALLACTPHTLLFSDRPGTLDTYPLHDALAPIPAHTQSTHPEFTHYTPSSPSTIPTPDQSTPLDKWTFLPTLYTAATLPPSHRFYLLLDPSTTISWTNLLQWLARLDYRIPYYIGAPASHTATAADTTTYARAAPGIVLSYAAMQQYRAAYEDYYNRTWDARVAEAEACCGDKVLAGAMKDSRVEFSSARGLFEYRGLGDIEWGEEFWCTPLVGWAGLGSEEREKVGKMEGEWTRKKGWDVAWTRGVVFGELVRGEIGEVREGWDNGVGETVLEPGGEEEGKGGGDMSVLELAPETPSNCQAACKANPECLQWKHRPAACHLGKKLRLGAKSDGKEERWTSGWMVERVGKKVEEWGRCERVRWEFKQ